MLELLDTVRGEGFESKVWYDKSLNYGFFIGDFDIDADGGPNIDGDPDWQPDTSLHHEGKPINAQKVPGMVVPGWLPARVGPIVLGCRGRLTNLSYPDLINCDCVVHDTGPLKKTGEGTPEAGRRIRVNPNSRHGGEDNPIILFQFWPGQAARIDGIEYKLQKS